MSTQPLRDELLRSIENLSPEKQQELLAYARRLTESTVSFKGIAGRDLVVFGGAIEPKDLARIAQAIEEDCEQVDRSAW